MLDQQLLVFVTVAERKNFSRAAEDLHITQPAVSHYIKIIEENMGTKLLERNNKVVNLTKTGEVVFPFAKEILGLYSRMQNVVDDMMHTAKGKLTVGASYTFGEYVLPHVIADLRREYPDITPSITIGNTTEIAQQVANRQLDVGIVEGDVTLSHLYIEPLANDLMVAVARTGHRITQKRPLTLSELEKETWIIREPGSGTREVTERMFTETGLYPESVMAFGSTQIIKGAVEAGLGISFLSRWVIRKELELGTIQILDMEPFPFKRQFSLVTQATPFQTKAMEIFVDLLHQKVAEDNDI
ncbi:LysR family transcriptional regulator [Tuberibacillus sp. Marseille-P3662]|uniref:LysR family transcriptional regulator n=1 Tax=Tuberibacillus sp. Marseille-P3662 TaxID=1965358 RepID=UPI000A1CDD23|nr:LysR family transcriptional regulator [Tuberibacillus sp. Marseille-P3662]